MHFTFEYPWVLLLLLLLPCFYLCKRKVSTQFLPKLEWIPKQKRLFQKQTLLRALIFALSVFALASPIRYSSIAPSDRKGINIVLALDTSGSMRESGFSNQDQEMTKFDLLKILADNFIQKRSGDNIGIVAFGTFAFSASPISYDLEGVRALLDMLEVEIAGKNTAIGEAIAQSVHTLRYGNAKEKVIILVTDGKNNSGSISVKDAVLMAKKAKIKIFTIGLGTQKEYDKKLLDRIAQDSGAKSFGAQNAKDLQSVYAQINHLLPSAIRSKNYLHKIMLYPWVLFIALTILFLYLFKRIKR